MLVLSRQRGETVMIGDKIDVTVIDVRGDKVRLGINAPREIAVHRKEIYEQIKEQNRRSADTKLEDLPKSFAPVVAGVLPVGPARPEASGLFTVWTDPKTGIESFVLSTRVAPLQQGFASAGSSMGAGERYLWFYCAFPPGGDADYGRTLGVVDLFDQDVRHFPETQFGSASPLVDRASGDAFWCTGAEVYRRPAGRGAVARRIARFDAAMGKCGPTISSHLSRSADGKWLSMDAHFDDHWHVGAVAVDGSSVDVWERFEEPVTAQFSPTDSDLMLVQGEGLWVLRKGEKARKIVEGRVASAAWMGEGILAVDGEGAVVRIDLEGKREVIVKGGVEQAAVDAGGKYVVVSGGGSLRFLNLATGKEMAIVGEMPAAPQPLQHYDARPSPRFCGDDRYVCYTTTVKGQVDVALALVERLATATA